MALITPEYTVRTSDVDERAIRAETPALLAQKLAAAKCRACGELPEDVVIDGCVIPWCGRGRRGFRQACGPGLRAAHDTRSGGQGPPGAHRRVHCRTGDGSCASPQPQKWCSTRFRTRRSRRTLRRTTPTTRPGLRRAERRGQICGGYRGLLFQCDGLTGVRVYNALEELDVL